MKNISSSAVVSQDVAKTSRFGFAPVRKLDRWLSKIECGRLTVELPFGTRRVFVGDKQGPSASLKIHDLRLVMRMMASGDLGFAESYLRGEWDTPDLSALLTFAVLNRKALGRTLNKSMMYNLFCRVGHALKANTKKGSKRNIAAHYDLGNDFFTRWLDETMSYSAGIFDDMNEAHEGAQKRKYRRLAQELDLKAGDRVLEIGCGWGGFAEIAAAEFGCEVVCLTLSVEQAAFAKERMKRQGLEDQVDIRLQDYRDVDGQFDRIVSIEMFEAVGEANWPTYFDVLHKRLKPGGKAGLQIITIHDAGFHSYRKNPDFIQMYIFPGGMLPSSEVLHQQTEKAGLTIEDSFYFRQSYAESLRRWDQDFMARWDEIAPQGFDERFKRMWHYYLCYCEVGFDQGQIDVGQFIVSRR